MELASTHESGPRGNDLAQGKHWEQEKKTTNSPREFSSSERAQRWCRARRGKQLWSTRFGDARWANQGEKRGKRSWRLHELDTKLGKVLTVMKEPQDGSATSSSLEEIRAAALGLKAWWRLEIRVEGGSASAGILFMGQYAWGARQDRSGGGGNPHQSRVRVKHELGVEDAID
jgi:hypothetical protein